MKRFLFSAAFCAVAMTGFAQTFTTVDGIRYEIKDDHAIVARQDKELDGHIVIPASIDYQEKPYAVTGMVAPTHLNVVADNTVWCEGGAFQDCDITSITLPATITVVGAGAFENCTSLSSVTLPEGVTTISAAAFNGCTSLTEVKLPSTVTDLGSNTEYGYVSYAFGGCTSLSSVNIPEGVKRIAIGCFKNTVITDFVLPSTLQELANDALASTAIETVKMGVRNLHDINCSLGVFGETATYSTITNATLLLPKGTSDLWREYEPWMFFKSIEEYGDEGEYINPDQLNIEVDGIRYLLKQTDAGDGWYAILKRQDASLSGAVVIPANVPYAGTTYPVWYIVEPSKGNAVADGSYSTEGGAFQGTKITEISLPEGLEKIPAGTFSDCADLVKATLAEGIKTLGAACFANCSSLASVTLPASLTDLGCETPFGYWSYAFGNCKNLKNITIPEGVTRLAEGTFKDSGLETLTIPAGMTQLGNACLDLPQLKTLTLLVKDKDQLTVSGRAFGIGDTSYLSDVDLIVPLGASRVYREYYPWMDFRSITDAGCSYLKLNGSIFTAPDGTFTVEDETPAYETHDAWYIDSYTQGLCIDNDTQIKFTTTNEKSWVYMYLFSSNTSKMKMDGEVVEKIGDDQSTSSYTYYRYDVMVDKGDHTISCANYDGNQVPCMFLLQVEDATATEHFEPAVITARIDNIRYILKETTSTENPEEKVYTATIGRQNKSLDGDIVIPEKVAYYEKEYTVTDFVQPSTLVAVADNTVDIEDGAFQGCPITSIQLPATITDIEAGAFFNCRQLEHVALPSGLKQLSAACFAGCSSLEEIFIPETVTDLGSNTVYGYRSYVFGRCAALKKVNIPQGVSIFEGGLFKDSGLETFLIAENIKTLKPGCLQAQSLREIKICHPNLTGLEWTEAVFEDVNLANVTLYVPEGSKTTIYEQVYPWKDFGTIEEYVDQADEHQYNAYRVEVEEEVAAADDTPAGVRRRSTASDLDVVEFIPSGVAFTMPEAPVDANGLLFDGWKSLPVGAVMPATDIKLTAVFTPGMTLSLKQGWNWVSMNLASQQKMEAVAFLDPIKEQTERLMSQTCELVNDAEYGLVGNLSQLTPQEGYRLKLSANVATATSRWKGTICTPSTTQLTLATGWNWIGFVPTAAMSLADALGSTPAEGDIIISQDADDNIATYTAEGWTGSLEQLMPGHCYHYKYNGTAAATFTYPDKAPAAASRGANRIPRHKIPVPDSWQCDAYQYPDVTAVIADLTWACEPATDYAIGAFRGNECRGVGQWAGGRLFLGIHGNVGDIVTFRATDSTGCEIALDGQLRLDGQSHGTMQVPVTFSLDGTTTGIANMEAHPASSVIYSLTGQRVNTLHGAARGIYVVGGRKVQR